jgi:hypothetical protein
VRSPRPHGPDGKFQCSGQIPLRRARERRGYDESQEPNQVARRTRRQAAKAAKPTHATPARDERGTFRTGNPGGGRKKGSKDILPRGSVKAVIQHLIESGQGHEKMLKNFDAGIQSTDKRAALGYLELAAKVLDKTEETGRVVHFHLHTNVDIYALGKAREQHGLPPIARRVDPEQNGPGK